MGAPWLNPAQYRIGKRDLRVDHEQYYQREQIMSSIIKERESENQQRIDLEVLNSVDHIITPSASDSECECVSESVNSHFGIRH